MSSSIQKHSERPGNPDPQFGEDGVVTLFMLPHDFHDSRLIKGLAIQPDGKIVFSAKLLLNINDQSVYALGRLDVNGNLDSDFATNGIQYGGFLNNQHAGGGKVAVQADGKIVLLGWTISETSDNYAELVIARFLASGDIDLSFGDQGKVVIENTDQYKFHEASDTLRVTPAGDILVSVNYADSHNNFAHLGAVFRFTPTGEPDKNFNGSGRLDFKVDPSNPFTAINTCLMQGEKILLGGHALLNGLGTAYVARLLADGTLDTTFGNLETPGLHTVRINNRDCAFNDMAEKLDGSVVCFGEVGDLYDESTQGLLRVITASGAPHLIFNNGKPLLTQIDTSTGNSWRCGYAQPDGRIVTASGIRNIYIARFLVDGRPDANFGMGGHIDVNTAVITEPSLLVRRSDDQILYAANTFGISAEGLGALRSFLG